jgi:predicted nucleotidyltransferase
MTEANLKRSAVASDLEPLVPLLERIVARLSPEEVWLFGSRAEGRARPDSDYELLVVMPDGTPEAQLDMVSAWNLVQGLDIPADIMPCTRAEFEEEKHEIDTLARAAFMRGRRIYERQP